MEILEKKSRKSELAILKNKKVGAFSDLLFFVARSTFRDKNPDMVADNRELCEGGCLRKKPRGGI